MFYKFRQNNSGGEYYIDKATGISVSIIVEAPSLEEANARAQEIGLYFDGVSAGIDCPCCGDRWYALDSDDVDEVFADIAHATEGYYEFTEDEAGYPSTYVHFMDGTFKGFKWISLK